MFIQNIKFRINNHLNLNTVKISIFTKRINPYFLLRINPLNIIIYFLILFESLLETAQ